MEKEVATHPLTIHFHEEHSGKVQETVFRIISKHYSALERQVMESVVIEEVAARKEECMNLKSEWAGSKLPGLAVTKPTGTSRKAVKEEGDKRAREEEMETEEGEEGNREGSPGNGKEEEKKKDEMKKEGTMNPRKRQRVSEPQEIQETKICTFTEVVLKLKGHSWSPGNCKEGEKSPLGRKKSREKQKEKGRRSPGNTPDPPRTPTRKKMITHQGSSVKTKIKRLQRKLKGEIAQR